MLLPSQSLKHPQSIRSSQMSRALLTSRLRNPLADLIISSPRLPVPALLKPALSTASQSHSSTSSAGRNACIISLPASSHTPRPIRHTRPDSHPFFTTCPSPWSRPPRPLWTWQPPPNGRPALPSTPSLFSTQQPVNLQNLSQITALLHSDPLMASCFTQDNLIRSTQLSAGPPAICDLTTLSLSPPAPASPTPFHCLSVALGAPCSGPLHLPFHHVLTQMSLRREYCLKPRPHPSTPISNSYFSLNDLPSGAV